MSAFSHLIGFTDYTDFSLIKSFFWGDDKKQKNEENTKKNQKNQKNDLTKVFKRKAYTFTKDKYNLNNLNEKQKKLILKLEKAFDNYLYRKKVQNLIQTLKENYMIVCTANIPNLYLNIIRNKKVKQYKLVYEPILKQNVAFLPRKIYRNKKKLKFVICNIKKEIFIEPQYQTEYEDGSFVNILDLSEIKEKEYKNEEDFNNFLKKYLANNKKEIIKKEDDKDEEDNAIHVIKVNKKEDLENKSDIIKVNKKEDLENKIVIKVNKKEDNLETKVGKKKKSMHKRLKSDGGIDNIAVKKGSSKSLLNQNQDSLAPLSPILKQRSSIRIKNQRKISFGNVQFSY
jgi:hypothetical protein